MKKGNFYLSFIIFLDGMQFPSKREQQFNKITIRNHIRITCSY